MPQQPLKPYSAQIKLAIWVILLASLLTGLSTCFGQVYDCQVSNNSGTVYKLATLISIGDSTIVFKTNGRESIYQRKKSTSESMVYFTDGVLTSSLSIMTQTGSIKGFKYNTAILFKQSDFNSSLLYCIDKKYN